MIGINDTVIVVNDSEPPQSAPPYVIKDRTYTVTAIETKEWPVGQVGHIILMGLVTFIWVAELPSETGHYAFRFRKVEKKSEQKKTDISIFRKMLDKTPEKA